MTEIDYYFNTMSNQQSTAHLVIAQAVLLSLQLNILMGMLWLDGGWVILLSKYFLRFNVGYEYLI